MNITIRDETLDDLAAIEALTKSAFLHAEHTSHTEHFIVNQLRNAQQLTVSLVAEDEGQQHKVEGLVQKRNWNLKRFPSPDSIELQSPIPSQTFISYHPHPISRNRNVTLGSNRLR